MNKIKNIRYNLYNLADKFKSYLVAVNKLSPISVKNYHSDLKHFYGWWLFYLEAGNQTHFNHEKNIYFYLKQINSQTITDYKNYLIINKIPDKTINRRLSTIRKFFKFLIAQNWIQTNPASTITNISKKKSKEISGQFNLKQDFAAYLNSKPELSNNQKQQLNNDINEFLTILRLDKAETS